MKIGTFLSVLIAGALFGFGLAYSSMIKPEVILSFLRFEDLGLLWVLGGASAVTMVAYQLLPSLLSKPLLAPLFGKHPSALNRDTLLGAALFGIGWGICGLCPGPALAGLGAGNWPVVIALAAMFAGAYVQGRMSRAT